MSKPLITRVWLGGLAAFAVGLMIAGFSLAMMAAFGGAFERMPMMHYGYDYVPARDGGLWMGVTGVVVGGSIAAVGALVQIVAWVGAVIKTYALADKTWFVVLLAGGLLGLLVGVSGFAVMLAYLVAGPDGSPAGARTGTPAPTVWR